jgi:hypothetical protein
MLTSRSPAWEVAMSNQSRPSAEATNRRISAQFDRSEWELVVTLPRRVLLAAVAAAPADGRRAAEGIAGIEAIASGLASTSPLVREVVSAIYAESYQEPDASSDSADVISVQTLAACRYAAQLVADRVSAQDTAAYREWLLHIAAVVTGVAQTVAAPSGPALTAGRDLGESRFLYALDGELRT